MQSAKLVFGITFAALLVAGDQFASAESSNSNTGASESGYNGQQYLVPSSPLDKLKQSIAAIAGGYPGLFDPKDLDNFFQDRGSTAAVRFLNQRGGNSRRASRLARNTLQWRRALGLARLDASQFPCDLFKMGLIFESGHAHARNSLGEYVETSPVIWVRLGALGSIVKQLERLSPARLMSFALHSPRRALQRIRSKARNVLQHYSQITRADRKAAKQHRIMNNLSARENESLTQVLKSIAWWIDDWVSQNPDTKATLVLDFEDSDYAFASWSVGEFFVKLDDMFPDLFEQVIGFRYQPRIWSLHSPISMFNRIFKSRVSSSPETDRKLKFVSKEAKISENIPRVDSEAFSMLPEYVSGTCTAPDDGKAPANCQSEPIESVAGGLYDPNFWQAIKNQFYYDCKAKLRANQ